MSGNLELRDFALQAATMNLVHAANELQPEQTDQPDETFPSLTGVGAQITQFVTTVALARTALADAARSMSAALSTLVSESRELDVFIAESVENRYSVPGDGAK